MKHLSILVLLFCTGSITIWSQSGNGNPIWSDIALTDIPNTGTRQIKPNLFRTIRADVPALKTLLFAAPDEMERPARHSGTVLAIPLPDGGFQRFRLVRYQMMEPELAAAYPEMATWHGVSDDKTRSTIRLDWTERGFHAMIRRPGSSYFIDPYAVGNLTDYVSYYKNDYPQPDEAFICHTKEGLKDNFSPESPDVPKEGDCVFRSYRLAVATTGEYSNYHGADNPGESGLVLSAVMTAINRVNEVFERDLAIRLVLIAGTSAVFYYNAGTDPYTNNNGSAMLTENQNNLNAEIGSANFDIGHVFSTGGGGVAALNGPCGANKARGVTGLSNPINDPFYIDYVAHEIGHQFGARHTFNNSCNNNRSNNTAMEPGSGSTIMAYAGICDPNVQLNSDDYFHGISLREIGIFVTLGNGNVCDTPIAFNNAPPSVAAIDNYTIPAATPFVLTAVASDPDGDPLSYCWEQWDNEIGAVMPPASTNLQGPMFRSFEPSTSPQRYFPRLQDLVSNMSPTWEVLPSVTRPMEFRVTVRDFADMTAGCSEEVNMFVNVNAAAGPFLVTTPNTAVTWTEGQAYTVNWDVALSNQAPVNCDSVAILLSYDGGFTYPVTLVSGTPNNGSAQIILPAGTTTTARVMVKANGNVFFDISDIDFIIESGTPDFAMSASPNTATICPTGSLEVQLDIASFGGFSDPITLSVSGEPAHMSVSFSTNPITPTSMTILTLGNLDAVAPGMYALTITGTSMGNFKDIPIAITILDTPAAITLASPVNNAVDIALLPTLTWAVDLNANSYEWQLALDGAFNTIAASGTSFGFSAQPGTELNQNTLYFWRVRGLGICGGTGDWSAVRSFLTVPCIVFSSSNVPRTISSVGTPVVNSVLDILETGALTDINVVNLSGDHTWISDLRITLISPANSEVILFDQPCMDQDNFDLNFDGQAATSTLPCPPTGGGTYRPVGNLGLMNTEEINGTWTLRIEDLANEDGGQLSSWGLRVCPTAYSGFLPVELTDFRVDALDQKARLHWVTASELNNSGFEVQRQTAQSGTFSPIAWVPAEGNGASRMEYVFIDNAPPKGEPVYYRLRQLDYDGSEAYSEIRSLTLAPDTGNGWRLFPNPATGYCTLESLNELNGLEVTVSILNIQGQMVFQNRFMNQRIDLDLNELPSGVFQVQVQGEGAVWTGRMIHLLP